MDYPNHQSNTSAGFGTSTSYAEAGGPHVNLGFNDIGARLQRIENENLKIWSEVHRADRADFCRHQSRHVRSADDQDDICATLKHLVMESIKPTESLEEGEKPGEDHVRHKAEYPHIKFYTDRDWNEYKREHRQSMRIGEEPVRGKKKSSQGENHTTLYLEHIDGSPASGDYVNDTRKFTRTLINLVLTTKYKMPRKWSAANVWLQDLFYTALRTKFPLFQLCHNNVKANLFMMAQYYDAVTRNLTDSEDHDGEGANVRNAPAPRTPASQPGSKRPSTTVPVAPRPTKIARIEAQGTDSDHPPESPSGKGKERASASLLSLVRMFCRPL
ncbi:hypothetical protein BD311DRAFT_782295 [Dichomitus squalens]|uniref:Uncharacterized protein n=1 Tax=Dichomitus squalens TaxID=114155 RepID=A0A4Q9M7W6_9APHY|nr:hypothetical protein BD311DRAFT_782295 [Dichomitus squalens]